MGEPGRDEGRQLGAATAAAKDREVVPTSEKAPVAWHYTTQAPSELVQPEFDASGMEGRPRRFRHVRDAGSRGADAMEEPDIWLRREFVMPEEMERPQFRMHHDEDADVYVDGVLATQASGYITSYEAVPIKTKARATLQAGQAQLGRALQTNHRRAVH